MKRWWIAGAGLFGAIAVFALVQLASVGGEAPPPKPEISRPQKPPREVRRPTAEGPPGAGVLPRDRELTPGSIPAQLADPNTPPDIRTAAAISGSWMMLARRFRYAPDAPDEWAALEEETNAISDLIKVFRTDPASGIEWSEVVARQTAIIPKIRAASPDEDMTIALDLIEAELERAAAR